MKRLSEQEVEQATLKEVFNVAEFCRRYRLDKIEERRLRTLLGEFATRHELLMNARRESLVR